MEENLAPAPAPDLVLVEVPSAQMTAPQMMVPTSEVVLHRRDDAPVHDWDLLSSGFQLEIAAYLQVVALVALVFLLTRRGKQLLASPLWRKDDERDDDAVAVAVANATSTQAKGQLSGQSEGTP